MYRVLIEKKALRFLKRISEKDAEKLKGICFSLSTTPRPRGSKKILGQKDLLRFRVGHYRIIYVVLDELKIVNITQIRERNEKTYKNL